MLGENHLPKRGSLPWSRFLAGLVPEPRAALGLLAGDVLTLLLFVYIGQRDHELVDVENPVRGVLLAALPFAIAWVGAALALGAYRVTAADLRPRVAFGRVLNAWLVAAPLGIVLRALWLDRAVIPTGFVLAALAFGGAMLLAWRGGFILLWRRRKS